MTRRTGAALCALWTSFLSGCGDIVVADHGTESTGGSTTSSGSAGATGGSTTSGGGTAAACATGAGFQTFGALPGGATIGVAADASGVYWSNDDGTVMKAESGGASPAILASGVGTELYTLALDESSIYVCDYAGSLWKLAKKGGSPVLLAAPPSGAMAVAADASGVYFTSLDGVRRVDSQGGPSQLLAAVEDADSIALDEGFVYVRTIGNTGDPTNRVVRVPKTGGSPVDIAPPEAGPLHYFSQELAVDATSVYWVNPSQGTVGKVAKSGGPAVVLASGLSDPVSVAADGGSVYFTVRGKDDGPLADRAVAKVPAAGGPVSFVAHGDDVSAYGLALDATRAYWTQKVVDGAVATACK